MTIHTPTVVGPVATRIRAELNGKTLADSRNVLLLRESPFKLYYYFPASEVEESFIDRDSAKTSSRKNGKVTSWTVRDGSKEVAEGAFSYTEPADDFSALRGRIGFSFEAADHWFEEDEELLGHPRDPYTRIDIRRTSQRLEVIFEGTTIIESRHPFLLTETGLPVRYYVPFEGVQWKYFRDSATVSVCPYKGIARYWSAVVEGAQVADIIWQYPEPLQDALRIKDTVGLYHEKLELRIDGQTPPDWPIHFSK